MNNHAQIEERLNFFHEQGKIPHIIFHGESNSGKETLVSAFVCRIYRGNRQKIKQNTLFVNCSGRGIKFIREEIKTFAKMHIQNNADGQTDFKTVVLSNADYLTEDAQSALRRSIELFSHNTRFFMIVENKYKLLKPILSRFCEIHVVHTPPIAPPKPSWLTHILQDYVDGTRPAPRALPLIALVGEIYERGFSCRDLVEGIRLLEGGASERQIHTLFLYHKLKAEYRNEKVLMLTLLDFFFFGSYNTLKNICGV